MERRPLGHLLLLLLASAAAIADAQTYAGDACKMKGGGAGVCRNISLCTAARDELTRGEPPAVCSYDGFTPVVCCPASQAPPPPSAPPPPPSERIAVRMCTKFAEAVYRQENTSHLPQQKVKVSQCGNQVVLFIAAGEEASPNEFPHMALLGYGDDPQQPNWSCGGSLISDRFVLTAGHCLITSQGAPKVVRLGELNLKSTEEINKHEDFGVAKSIPHPQYKLGVFYNDIGLLQLERIVTFTASIRPACLHPVHDMTDTDVIASGWGFTDLETSEITDHLMKVKITIRATEVCQNAYKTLSTTSRLRNGIMEESMVCAGERKNICRGDSGGPLQVKLKNPFCMYRVVGIASFRKGNCGISTTPAIYTRVSFFIAWIENVVWPNQK